MTDEDEIDMMNECGLIAYMCDGESLAYFATKAVPQLRECSDIKLCVLAAHLYRHGVRDGGDFVMSVVSARFEAKRTRGEEPSTVDPVAMFDQQRREAEAEETREAEHIDWISQKADRVLAFAKLSQTPLEEGRRALLESAVAKADDVDWWDVEMALVDHPAPFSVPAPPNDNARH